MSAAFKKVNTDNRDVNKLQDNVKQVLEPVLDSAIIDGTLLTSIELTTGQPNLVEHRLDRKPLGWLIVRRRAQSDVWDAQDLNTLPSRTLDLRCSANVTVDIWVF